MRRRVPGRERRGICMPGWTGCLVPLIFLFLGLIPLHAASHSPDPDTGAGVNVPAAGEQVEEAGSIPSATASRPSDDYGNVTKEEAGGGEDLRIADPN